LKAEYIKLLKFVSNLYHTTSYFSGIFYWCPRCQGADADVKCETEIERLLFICLMIAVHGWCSVWYWFGIYIHECQTKARPAKSPPGGGQKPATRNQKAAKGWCKFKQFTSLTYSVYTIYHLTHALLNYVKHLFLMRNILGLESSYAGTTAALSEPLQYTAR